MPTATKLASSVSAERANLAEIIERHDAVAREVVALAEEISSIEPRLARAKREVEGAQKVEVERAHLTGVVQSDVDVRMMSAERATRYADAKTQAVARLAELPPLTRSRRELIGDAEDETARLSAAIANLRERHTDAAERRDILRTRLLDAVQAVKQADPAYASLRARRDEAQRHFVALDRALAVADGRSVVLRDDDGLAAQWRAALLALAQDADAVLPNEATAP